MNFRVAVKLGVISSVILFCIGVAFYGFAKLDLADEERNIDLFEYVPQDCIGVFESDNVDYFMDKFSHMAYWSQLDTLRNTKFIQTTLSGLTNLTPNGSHGIGSYTRHVVISFHDESDPYETIAYFKVNDKVKRHLTKVLYQKYGIQYNPKVVKYRGQRIDVYPIDSNHYMSILSRNGVVIVSFQKRLIEKVIDAYKDKVSLRNDSVFNTIPRPKTANYMTFYGKTPAIPISGSQGESYWSEYNLHMNSEVFYLGGATYEPLSSDSSCIQRVRSKNIATLSEDNVLLACGVQKVDSCISTLIAEKKHTLFNECVTSLSRDAVGIMVIDMEKYLSSTEKYSRYLPPFLSRYPLLFRSFIMSSQFFNIDGRLHHIYIFTYKD